MKTLRRQEYKAAELKKRNADKETEDKNETERKDEVC